MSTLDKVVAVGIVIYVLWDTSPARRRRLVAKAIAPTMAEYKMRIRLAGQGIYIPPSDQRAG